MKVLLVEDEASLAGVLSRNVSARGHDVTTVGSAQGALDSLGTTRPDALVLDVNLPDESGWEVLRRIDPQQRDRLRVIVISAAPISPRRLAEFRPARWFLKPFPISALIRALSPEPSAELQEVD
jgi:DNA-binding response OmpR family regulator